MRWCMMCDDAKKTNKSNLGKTPGHYTSRGLHWGPTTFSSNMRNPDGSERPRTPPESQGGAGLATMWPILSWPQDSEEGGARSAAGGDGGGDRGRVLATDCRSQAAVVRNNPAHRKTLGGAVVSAGLRIPDDPRQRRWWRWWREDHNERTGRYLTTITMFRLFHFSYKFHSNL